MAKKKKVRAKKVEVEMEQDQSKAESPTPKAAKQAKLSAEQQIKAIIEKGRKKGFLTYEEMNKELPEEAATPARLDSLLATLDEMGIRLVDETDMEKHEEDEFEDSGTLLVTDEAKQLKEDEELEKQLVGAEVAHRIDDPIRM